MKKMLTPEESIGKTIISADMIGSLDDNEGQCIEAEVIVAVGEDPSRVLGKFTVELVTKDFFMQDGLKRTFDALDDPSLHVGEKVVVEQRPPYVLNDANITDEVLVEKFIGRTIKEDLAQSLWIVADS